MRIQLGDLRQIIKEELKRIDEFSARKSKTSSSSATRRTSTKGSWKNTGSQSFFGFGGGGGGGGYGGGGGGWGDYGSYWPDWVDSWGHQTHDTSDLPSFMQPGESSTQAAVDNAHDGQFGGDFDAGVDADGDGGDGDGGGGGE